MRNRIALLTSAFIMLLSAALAVPSGAAAARADNAVSDNSAQPAEPPQNRQHCQPQQWPMPGDWRRQHVERSGGDPVALRFRP